MKDTTISKSALKTRISVKVKEFVLVLRLKVKSRILQKSNSHGFELMPNMGKCFILIQFEKQNYLSSLIMPSAMR